MTTLRDEGMSNSSISAVDPYERHRRPYTEKGESRRPMLTWPREIPFDGKPIDVHDIVSSYAAWLQSTDISKLFINADPGAILTGRQREFCRTWANQQEIISFRRIPLQK